MKKLILAAVERTAITYRFRSDEGFGWAICTVNDSTGELVIVSDYGNWAYRWNTAPSALGHPTLTAFLAERGGVDYLARKLQGSRGGERFSATKTAAAIGKLIAQRRLEDGREQWENRWDDDFPIPAHVRGYDECGLPISSHCRPRSWTYGRPYEGAPYLTRDAARELWDKVEAVAYDCGNSPDLFLERLPRELHEIVEEPWRELQHEQTPEDRALRELVLPALIEACRVTAGVSVGEATAGETSIRTARKEHQCEECAVPIRRGDRYEHASMLFDGHWSTHKTCLPCVEIRDHFACGNGYLFGELWNDLVDNFFRHMTCGGPCMVGLSPTAKAKLIDERMAWYLAQDEVDDSKWDGDRWRPGADREPRPAPAFVPPAYALLEYESCSEWGCRVGELLGYLRRGGLDEHGKLVHPHLTVLEQRIRDAERYCRQVNGYIGHHTESIVPDEPRGFE